MDKGHASHLASADEKKTPIAHTAPVTATEELVEEGKAFDSTAHWRPGFFAQFPWLGLGALGGVLFCLVACVLVLVLSNNKTQTKTYDHRAWPKAVAPNVLISIFNSVANICFGIAISNGVAIAWWRRALKGGTIRDLNKSWQFSSSVKEIALSGKAFNVIALTALVAKMTLIDSTLLQKAIGTYTQQDYLGLRDNVVYGYINTTFPTTGIGRTSVSLSQSSGLQPWFNQDLEIWQTGGGVYPNEFDTYTTPFGQKKNSITRKMKNIDKPYRGSVAYVKMNGAGLQFDCLDPVTEKIDASALSRPSETNRTGPVEQTLFGITFSVHHGGDAGAVSDPTAPDAWVNNSDYIVMETAYSTAQNIPSADLVSKCPGTLTRQTCRLRAAVVQYPVMLSQRGDPETWTARIGTDDDLQEHAPNFYHFDEAQKQQNYFAVQHIVDLQDFPYAMPSSGGTAYGNSTYSGLALALQMYVGGHASISKDPVYSFYNLKQEGSSQTYLDNVPVSGNCDFNFVDPRDGGRNLLQADTSDSKAQFIDPGLIARINSIMFGLVTDVSGLDNVNNHYQAGSSYYNASMWADTIHYQSNFWYMGGAIASTIICILCVLPSYYGFWQLGRKVTLGPFEIAAAFRAPNLNHETHANAPVDKLLEQVGDRRVQFGHIVSGADVGRIGVAEEEFVERVKPQDRVVGEEIRAKLQQSFNRNGR